MYCAYILIDTKDFKVFYVGKTHINRLKIRKSEHRSHSQKRRNKRANKIKKLLREGCDFHILPVKFYKTEKEAYEDESNVISLYKNRGYNLCNSTEGGEGLRNPTKETRKKMAQNARERFMKDQNPSKKPEVKKLRSEFFKKNNPMHNPQIKRKAIKAIISSCGKKVCQFSLEGDFIEQFNSIRDASRKTNINREGISRCCREELKTSGGFVWKFFNNFDKLGRIRQ